MLNNDGYPMQFGSAPGLGCAEVVSSLKPMLRMRRENRIDSHALFPELMKSRDNAKHESMSIALNKIGAVPKHAMWMEKSCREFNAAMKIGGKERGIERGSGSSQ